MLLQGQVAVVTGAGRGIGRAIARRFAAEGAAVVAAARTEKEVKAVAAEIQKAGGRALALAADVSRVRDCEKIILAAVKQFGEIHILVNNAGIFGPVSEAEKIAPPDWDEVLAINLTAPFLLARLVLPQMYTRRSGVILNISSVSGKLAAPWNAPYAASKAGLLGLTRTLAAEGARKGVRVNALCPGPVTETRMSQELGPTFAKKLGVSREQQLAGFLETVLMGRAQTAEEVAQAALFLCSSQASAITAQAVNVDGGMAYC